MWRSSNSNSSKFLEEEKAPAASQYNSRAEYAEDREGPAGPQPDEHEEPIEMLTLAFPGVHVHRQEKIRDQSVGNPILFPHQYQRVIAGGLDGLEQRLHPPMLESFTVPLSFSKDPERSSSDVNLGHKQLNTSASPFIPKARKEKTASLLNARTKREDTTNVESQLKYCPKAITSENELFVPHTHHHPPEQATLSSPLIMTAPVLQDPSQSLIEKSGVFSSGALFYAPIASPSDLFGAPVARRMQSHPFLKQLSQIYQEPIMEKESRGFDSEEEFVQALLGVSLTSRIGSTQLLSGPFSFISGAPFSFDQRDSVGKFQNLEQLGSYSFQKYVESCDAKQRTSLLRKLNGHLYMLSKDNNGTHIVQTFIEQATTPQEEELLMAEFLDRFAELACDKNATHIPQKAFLTFQLKNQHLIFRELLTNFTEVATIKDGLNTIKKMLVYVRKREDCQELVVREISRDTIVLAQNPYGNYALQIILNTFKQSLISPIIESIQGKLSQLSITKYSSPVVECCLEKAEPVLLSRLLEELRIPSTLLTLMKNTFGNYVLQKALSLGNSEEQVQMAVEIQMNITYLTNKNLKSKWNSIIEKCGAAQRASDFSKCNIKSFNLPSTLNFLHNFQE